MNLAVSNQRRIWRGILIAALGVPLIILFFGAAYPDGAYSSNFILFRELSILAFTAAFLVWILRVEREPLSSIGLHGRHWGISILGGLGGMAVSFIVAALLIFIFSKVGIAFGQGAEAQKFEKVSPWVILVMVLRAGIAEEVFYRGYLMERLSRVSRHWAIYFLLPLVVFALWHYRQGLGGIILSFCLGAVLAAMYWKKRDLKANIIAHFLVDFVPNVLVPMVGVS
jgi:membrane protease YdiL (CAAX protease family)